MDILLLFVGLLVQGNVSWLEFDWSRMSWLLTCDWLTISVKSSSSFIITGLVCRIKKIEHLDSLIKLDVLDLHGNEVSLIFRSVLFSMSMLSKHFSRDDASHQQHIAFVLSCPLFILLVLQRRVSGVYPSTC